MAKFEFYDSTGPTDIRYLSHLSRPRPSICIFIAWSSRVAAF